MINYRNNIDKSDDGDGVPRMPCDRERAIC